LPALATFAIKKNTHGLGFFPANDGYTEKHGDHTCGIGAALRHYSGLQARLPDIQGPWIGEIKMPQAKLAWRE